MIEPAIFDSQTIPEMFVQRCYAIPDAIAYEHEVEGVWQKCTWNEYGLQVEETALGLAGLGLGRGECIAIFGDTMPEWTILSLGAQSVGAHVAGIYQTSTPEQAIYILQDAKARVLCVDRMERLVPILAMRDQIPLVRRFVVWQQQQVPEHADIMHLDELRGAGRQFAKDNPGAFEARLAELRPEDYAVLVYTSGTTGKPKGVILTHDNCMTNAKRIFDKDLYEEGDSLIAFLPMSHVAEYMAFLGRILGGLTSYFCPVFTDLPRVLKEKGPTLLVAVPRVYEKIQQKIISVVESKPPRQRQLFYWALGVGDTVARLREQKRMVPPHTLLLHQFADRVILKKVREQLGGKLRGMFTAAAPIDVEVIRFFWAIGIPLLEAYGLSESAGASHTNLPEDYRIGSVGKPIAGLECKIAEDGEILMRGPSIFKGYLNKPEETREMLDEEGWLHTGDIGKIDADGYLYITDRKKNLIITAGGKNVAPAASELLIKREPLVSQVVVLGDRKPYLVALVTLAPDVVAQEKLDAEQVHARIAKAIENANTQLARYEQIRKFRIVDREFSIESGEMTPTMKLKRNVIAQHHAHLVEEMYSETDSAAVV